MITPLTQNNDICYLYPPLTPLVLQLRTFTKISVSMCQEFCTKLMRNSPWPKRMGGGKSNMPCPNLHKWSAAEKALQIHILRIQRIAIQYRLSFCRVLLQYLLYLVCKKSNTLQPNRVSEGGLSKSVKYKLNLDKIRPAMQLSLFCSLKYLHSPCHFLPSFHATWSRIYFQAEIVNYVHCAAASHTLYITESSLPALYCWEYFCKNFSCSMGISLHPQWEKQFNVMMLVSFILVLLALFRLEAVFWGPNGHQTRLDFLAMTHNPCQAGILNRKDHWENNPTLNLK